MWQEYEDTRMIMCTFIDNMEDVKYLYLIVLGDKHADYDMYLLDDYDNPLYQTGNYEEREPELNGVDTSKKIETTITTGKWGWLCSAYVPVYDADGNIVCHVGCDIDMEGSMIQRFSYIIYILISSLVITVIVLIIALIFVNKIFISPLKKITDETRKFDPENNLSYDEANVISINMKNRNDEISDIYDVIRTTQMNIIDYLNDMSKLEKDKQRYLNILRQFESDIRDRDDRLDKMNAEAYNDELTGVGNKTAYARKVEELSKRISKGVGRFAIVMVDLNDLKRINDYVGHKAGDNYIKGSCAIISKVFSHSPIYRIGGDEFVVIATGLDYQERDVLVRRLRMEYYNSYYNTAVPPYERYCAAVGIGVFEKGDTVESVFRRADQSMYSDKMSFKHKNGSYR